MEASEFKMTIGEARGFAEIIAKYPHLTLRDVWDPDHNDVVIEPPRGHSPMIVRVATEARSTWREDSGRVHENYRSEDQWQVLRNGHTEQLTRGTEVVI
jgi:hypothetical protein